jgi:hypothetical protein
VEEATQRVVAVTMDLNGSSLQLQAFAAPRSEGLWDEIREQIGQSVGGQGGQVEEVQGEFGTELIAKLPAGGADGSHGYRVARFIGVDGPRWFLRGVLGGEAALDRDAASGLEGLFRQIVVVRGDNPMPPRDLLPRPRAPLNSRSPTVDRKSPRLADKGGAFQEGELSISELPDRGRVVCHGFVESVTYVPASDIAAFTVVLKDRYQLKKDGTARKEDDGDSKAVRIASARPARLRVTWLGRRRVPGIDAGVELRLEGMLTLRNGLPTMFNPRYEILSRQENQ